MANRDIVVIDLPAQLYRQRAADTEANSKILRDFLLRVNLDETGETKVTLTSKYLPNLE